MGLRNRQKNDIEYKCSIEADYQLLQSVVGFFKKQKFSLKKVKLRISYDDC